MPIDHVAVWLDDATLGAPVRIGALARSTSRTGDAIRFDYDQAWLDGSSGLSPFALDHDLRLTPGPQYAPGGADSLAAIFADCSPDRWGRMLMERREAIEARAAARPIRALRAWDFLVGVHDPSRMGALRFQDEGTGEFVDAHALGAPPTTELRALEAASLHVETDADDADVARWLQQLVAPGASLGGARPKASFRDTDGSLWLAKFPAHDDRRDVGLWEFITHELAIVAGIDMPPARAIALSSRGHTFAVQRFDRAAGSRRFYASAMTRLARNESEGASYLDLVEAIETDGASGAIHAQLEQLFRRVLFNVLIGNRDDHLRNHGFLRAGNGWALSPAFDVNPNPDKVAHVLTVDGTDDTPDSDRVLATAEFYRLKSAAAKRVADEVRRAVGDWETRARSLGARAAEIALMRGVIDPAR